MYDWNRHQTTAKHQNNAKLNKNLDSVYKSTPVPDNISENLTNKNDVLTAVREIEPLLNQIAPKKRPDYKCSNCNKIYNVKSSLWYHKKKCLHQENTVLLENKIVKPESVNQQDNSNIIVELLKQNQELQKQIIEMAKEPKITTITNNNQFNLNMFLNENCKNALNIMDFVNSLDLTIKDLEETGRLGYVNGISRIFINALKNMDINMRPIHCTDIKRETVYVKDKDTWEKDNDEKEKMKKVLEHISHKNLKLLPEWQQQNPDFRHLDTPENQQFMKISLSSLGAEYEEEQAKMEKKILKNVMKEVVIEKTTV